MAIPDCLHRDGATLFYLKVIASSSNFAGRRLPTVDDSSRSVDQAGSFYESTVRRIVARRLVEDPTNDVLFEIDRMLKCGCQAMG